ncbi:hypothetical protein [Streptomyces sp. NPDC001774]
MSDTYGEDFDPISLSPQVEEVIADLSTPAEVFGAVAACLVELREALELGLTLPPGARPVPGEAALYSSFMPGRLGLIEYRPIDTVKGPGFYVTRVIRLDDYPTGF